MRVANLVADLTRHRFAAFLSPLILHLIAPRVSLVLVPTLAFILSALLLASKKIGKAVEALVAGPFIILLAQVAFYVGL